MKKRTKETSKETCVEQSDDLNVLALAEFRRLLYADKSLDQEWKAAAVALTDAGIPEELSSFDELIDGVDDANTENPKG